MNKKAIDSVKNRESRTHYQGVYSDFQSFGQSFNGKRYSQIEFDYTKTQNFLYKRAIFGLKMYTQEEIREMHWQKKKRIQKVHKRTQKELNTWKQSRLIEITNSLFGMFHRSSLAQELLEAYSEPDPEFICKTEFKDLGISKDDVVEKLLEVGILPHTFKSITDGT